MDRAALKPLRAQPDRLQGKQRNPYGLEQAAAGAPNDRCHHPIMGQARPAKRVREEAAGHAASRNAIFADELSATTN
jgi:GrpB-like predicted nucleotidyltransferase (UPF0157 family)